MSKPFDAALDGVRQYHTAAALRRRAQTPSDHVVGGGAAYIPGALPNALRASQKGELKTAPLPNEQVSPSSFDQFMKDLRSADAATAKHFVRQRRGRSGGEERKVEVRIKKSPPRDALTFGDALSLTRPHKNSQTSDIPVPSDYESNDE